MLLFKLFEERHKDVIPIAGILAPEKSSRLVITQNHIQSLYQPTIHELEKEGNYFVTPYLADSDYGINLSSIQNGLIVSDNPQYNCYYQLNNAATATPNIRLLYLKTNRPLTNFKVEYQNGTSWQDIPNGTGAQTVRVKLLDEDAARDPIIIIYNTPTQMNHYELMNTPTPLFQGDWSLSIQNNRLAISTSGLLASTTKLYVKQNALKRIQAIMPHYQWYQDWHILVRKGVLITETSIFDITGAPYSAPPTLQKNAPVTFISREIVQVPIPDIDISKTITVYFDGEVQDDIVNDYAPQFGIIRLKRPVPAGVDCRVDYEVVSTNWIELSSVDFNPHQGHSSGKRLTNITDVGVTFWIQPIHMGGNIMRSYTSEPGVAFFEKRDGFLSIRGGWEPLITAKIRKQPAPGFVDIRESGGGLKEDFKEKVEWLGCTDWGFYDGKPIDNISLVVRIPRSKYNEVYDRYRNQGFGETEAHLRTKSYIEEAVTKFAPVGVNIIYQDKDGNPLFS